MSQTPRPLIHVGYHKTATSWMQTHLFQPANGFTQIMTHAEVWTWIASPHPLAFDPAPVRALLAQRIAALPAGQIPVISSEVLCGQPFEGGHEGPGIAERLARIAPDARILITIREQLRIIASHYMQYLSRGGTLPPDGFLDGTDVPGYRGFEADHFLYDRFVALYEGQFGPENVHVAPQEALRADMDGFAADIARFAGATAFTALPPAARVVQVPSYPEHGIGVLRRLNHLRRGPMHTHPPFTLGTPPKDAYRLAGWLLRRPSVMAWLGGRKPVSRRVRARFEDHFAGSNARLQTMRPGLDLTGYQGIGRPAGRGKPGGKAT